MAFYISQPKVRQAGFELPNKTDEERQPSPAYDPSMYFTHNNFGSPFDAFSNRPKYNDHSVDFADTLATMISESDTRNGTHHYPPQPNPFDPHQFPHASSGHPILSPTGSAFGGFPASAPATSHAPFFEPDYAFMRGSAERADTPSLASPTADSPFSQAPPTAPSKRGSGSAASRSRSRGPAAASTSRTRGARKRQSISSPSPPPVANGASAVLIPSQNAWYIPSSDNPSFGFLGNTPSSLTMPSSIAGASPKSLAKVSMSEDLASKQAQLLSEKRRRRRESHNAVERRRRDNINEKISELSTLIPECLLTEVPAAKDDVLGPVDEESTREGPKANKGMILRKSVDYIKYLQQLVRAQASRNRELESQLSQYRGGDESSESPNPSLLPLSSGMDSVPAVDLGNLLPIEDEDSLMSSVALNAELSSQILANIEGASPSEDGDDDEELRGRQAERQRRFASRPSLSVSKSEMVEEVDESALSDGSGKMED